jgi:X-Pro dipeptidyl-peptidase
MRPRIVGLLALALAAGFLVPSAQAAPIGQQEQIYVVPTRHGHLYVEVVHPTRGGKIVKAPAILTYSPYSVLGRNGDTSRWVPRGYARMWADVVGTGNSGGCYDYGGKREKETGYDLVEWAAKQSWSTGKIGMIGGSYDGTTAIATATQRPPHLTTIVPEAAISRWYEYAYSGGMRYVVNNEKAGKQGPGNGLVIDEQGFDTPLAFDFGFGGAPPTDVTEPNYAERLISASTPCDEVAHVTGAYNPAPDYNDFWLERDYVKDAAKITIPVLVGHNWGDWNVKQEEAFNFWRALTRSKNRRLYMGTRWSNHGVPGGEYKDTVNAWMDYYLMGVRNGIDKVLPPVVSETSDSSGKVDFVRGMPPVTQVRLNATNDFRLVLAPNKKPVSSGDIPITGQGTESRAAQQPEGDVARGWAYFETPPLADDVRIFGEIKILVGTTTGREWLTLTPSVFDIDPETRGSDGSAEVREALVGVTRGWLDTRYAKTLRQQNRQQSGRPTVTTVVAKPQDYVFRAGHSIGLIVQTEMNEWVMPKAYDSACATCGTYRIDFGSTALILPVAGKVVPAKLFG